MRTWERTKGDIIERLKDDKVSTIVFVGATGMGKTLMAKEISECTIKDGSCDPTLWVYVTAKYDVHLFYKDIDRQLCLSSNTEEWEYEEKKTVSNLKTDEFIQWGHADQKEKTTEELKQMIQEKLEEIGSTLSVENNYLLLVLDDVGNDLISNADLQVKLSQDWISLFPSKFRNRLKIIITTKQLGDCNAQQISEVIEFPPYLQLEELLQLLRERVDKKVSEVPSFQNLDHAIAEKSEGKPAAIIVIAKALNYIAQADASELRSAILKAAYYEKTSQVVNPLFYCACDMIKSSVTRNCFWHCIYLFRNYGGVHYNELITHWIMEGYFDPFDQIEEAYRKGYDVLTELISRALLKVQENNIVTVEGALLKMTDSYPLRAALRLLSVYKDSKSLGRVTRMNGMIKTLCNPRVWEKNTTLLIDNNRFSQEVLAFFNSMKKLKVLAVFKPRCGSWISSLSKMDKLLVLVLRRCDLLDNVAGIDKLRTLKVLEISGDSHLLSLPDKQLDGSTHPQSLNLYGLSLPSLYNLTHLQSLNLSGLQIESLPSLSSLRELRYLILRHLSCLKEVQSLKELVNLEILDLSGASSLKSMPSDLFDETTNLQSLNLSELQIKSLPSFSKLVNLEILDLSSASSLESMPSDLFDETTNLQSLNLSELQIESLPSFSKLTKLRVLILRRCFRLKKLQSLQGLGQLELLDISDATSFESFEDPTLSVIPKIRKIGLSNTNIPSLPEFDELKELTHIFLSGCRNLRDLPKLQLLTSLQVLDLSGAIMFATFEDRSIENLDQLTILDLSRTSISRVPNIPRSLLELNLMDCLVLEDLPFSVYPENLQTTDAGWAPTCLSY